MSGLTDLDQLLRQMAPVLKPGKWVFVSVEDAATARSLEPICTFIELEGVTAICARKDADRAKLRYDGVFSQITLNVNSSLHAVGLVAAVADELRRSRIPCNIVSAFHHDHLFVAADRAEEAQRLLENLSREQEAKK